MLPTTPKLGWTPRAPSAPHTLLGQRGSLSGRSGNHLQNPDQKDGRMSHPNGSHHPLTPTGGNIGMSPGTPQAKSMLKAPTSHSLNTRPLTPKMMGPSTPSWLKGAYRAASQPASAPPPTTTESWCKQRLDAIKATVEGGDSVPELRKVMDNLEYSKIDREIETVRKIRREFWLMRERQQKAAAELRRAEREVHKYDAQASHTHGKVARLRSYEKFIEAGWVDENPPSEVTAAAAACSDADSATARAPL